MQCPRGLKHVESRLHSTHFKHHPAYGGVPAFGLKEFLSLRDAGLINGACGHILETDDSDRTGLSHPGVMVITPALLSATASHKSGKDLISACVAGYEVMLRVGTALGLPHYAVWHTTGTTGVLGGVISAGKIMELSREKLTHAFGNAGTLSCGLWEFNKTHAMSKILHVGVGVSNALLCVELAQEGFTGAEKILEGTQGLFAGFNRSDADLSVLMIMENFGDRRVSHLSLIRVVGIRTEALIADWLCMKKGLLIVSDTSEKFALKPTTPPTRLSQVDIVSLPQKPNSAFPIRSALPC